MPLRQFIEGGDGDERQDPETRGRLKEIQAGLAAWQERVDHRYRRVSWLLGAMVVGALAAMVVGYGLLQGQRWDSIQGACESRNQQADATVLLLRDVGARESVILAAQARYPHTPPLAHREPGGRIVEGPPRDYEGPMTCSESADEQVGRFRL